MISNRGRACGLSAIVAVCLLSACTDTRERFSQGPLIGADPQALERFVDDLDGRFIQLHQTSTRIEASQAIFLKNGELFSCVSTKGETLTFESCQTKLLGPSSRVPGVSSVVDGRRCIEWIFPELNPNGLQERIAICVSDKPFVMVNVGATVGPGEPWVVHLFVSPQTGELIPNAMHFAPLGDSSSAPKVSVASIGVKPPDLQSRVCEEMSRRLAQVKGVRSIAAMQEAAALEVQVTLECRVAPEFERHASSASGAVYRPRSQAPAGAEVPRSDSRSQVASSGQQAHPAYVDMREVGADQSGGAIELVDVLKRGRLTESEWGRVTNGGELPKGAGLQYRGMRVLAVSPPKFDSSTGLLVAYQLTFDANESNLAAVRSALTQECGDVWTDGDLDSHASTSDARCAAFFNPIEKTVTAVVARPSVEAANHPDSPRDAPGPESSWLTATISDPDGFTNVRSAPNGSAPIIGRVLERQRFKVEPSTGDWWKVEVDGLGVGYMHRSRIALERSTGT